MKNVNVDELLRQAAAVPCREDGLRSPAELAAEFRRRAAAVPPPRRAAWREAALRGLAYAAVYIVLLAAVGLRLGAEWDQSAPKPESTPGRIELRRPAAFAFAAPDAVSDESKIN